MRRGRTRGSLEKDISARGGYFRRSYGSGRPAHAQVLAPQERLCDPSFQDCRADLFKYINQETVGIDTGFWLMDDDRYRSAFVAAFNSGVRVRILMDPRCVRSTCSASRSSTS